MPGYTYVRESKYGEGGQSKREIIYRSKSLHGTFYYTKTEKSEFEKISEMSSPGFEEYCHGIIAKNGWKVYKNNPIDGGIDIRALKEDEKGNIRTLLVQCKMWRTPIPPGAIRDFKAGCDEEKVDGTKELMFMAFSKFSPGAVEYANKYNIVLVDGDQLINKNVKYN
jgi:restriction endonuclease Mrr